MLKGDGGPIVAQKKRKRERKRERRGEKEGKKEEVRGGFKTVGKRGRGRDIRLECKVVVQVLGHDGIAKGKGGFGEDFRWMVLGGEEKGGGVVVDFVGHFFRPTDFPIRLPAPPFILEGRGPTAVCGKGVLKLKEII